MPRVDDRRVISGIVHVLKGGLTRRVGTRRNPIHLLREAGALGLQDLHDVAVMHDLVPYVDREPLEV
jgi:hypothetical protein